MPTYIQHRVNLSNSLRDCDVQGGVEIDVRSCVDNPQKMHLSHDPWHRGDDLDAWLDVYAQLEFAGPLIVNTKEDGLEGHIAERLHRMRIDNYFFLDTTPPTLARCLGLGWGRHMSVRLSKLEPPAVVEPWFELARQAPSTPAPGWLWIDCFAGKPLPMASIRGFAGRLRLCLVSPELQGQPCESVTQFQHLAHEVDAICTKHPNFWQNLPAPSPN